MHRILHLLLIQTTQQVRLLQPASVRVFVGSLISRRRGGRAHAVRPRRETHRGVGGGGQAAALRVGSVYINQRFYSSIYLF